MIEIEDTINGKHWVIQEKVLWWWSDCWGESIHGCTFWNKEEADKYWDWIANGKRFNETVLKQTA